MVTWRAHETDPNDEYAVIVTVAAAAPRRRVRRGVRAGLAVRGRGTDDTLVMTRRIRIAALPTH